jgi:two-component system sensor histidine kinase CreC
VNVGELVREACRSLEPAFAAHSIDLDFQSEPNAMCLGDAMLLEMAVDNLLQNALDFAPAGSTITIRVKRTGQLVVLTVQDQGPGVPEYALGRVFERFYSLQRPATGRKSSGLGLCFVREAAHLHGGEAKLESLGQGGALATLSLAAA